MAVINVSAAQPSANSALDRTQVKPQFIQLPIPITHLGRGVFNFSVYKDHPTLEGYTLDEIKMNVGDKRDEAALRDRLAEFGIMRSRMEREPIGGRADNLHTRYIEVPIRMVNAVGKPTYIWKFHYRINNFVIHFEVSDFHGGKSATYGIMDDVRAIYKDVDTM
jgi:hypothetical protein